MTVHSSPRSTFLARARLARRFAQLVTVLPILLTVSIAGRQHTPLPAVVIACALFAAFVALQVTDVLTLRMKLPLRVGIALAVSIGVAFLTSYATLVALLQSPFRDAFELPAGVSRDAILQGFSPLEPATVMGGVAGLMQCALWVTFGILPGMLENERTRSLEVENLRLEANQLRTRAEIVRLRGQLEPHFLLNTLNLISGLVTQNPARARDVLVTLGDLLQDALVERGEHDDLHTIKEEVEWLRRYVDILEARHGDFLKVEWDIESQAKNARVPRLLLQPLIENAIQHGALCKSGNGSVRVRIQLRGEALHCEIVDNGPGIGNLREGAIGLENVRTRLRLHFPNGQFELSRANEETTASIVLPYSRNASESPSDVKGKATHGD
jgi:two-component sensor histidine kinase